MYQDKIGFFPDRSKVTNYKIRHFAISGIKTQENPVSTRLADEKFSKHSFMHICENKLVFSFMIEITVITDHTICGQ